MNVVSAHAANQTLAVVAMLVAGAMTLQAQVASLEDRIGGASGVIVATARSVRAEWRETAHGDRIIVSQVQLEVNETLRGTPSASVRLEVDGGSLDGVTLQVSGLHLLQPGERAVVFLDGGRDGVYRPYLRGQGILLLDEQNMVRGSSLRLDDIRSRARGWQQ